MSITNSIWQKWRDVTEEIMLQDDSGFSFGDLSCSLSLLLWISQLPHVNYLLRDPHDKERRQAPSQQSGRDWVSQFNSPPRSGCCQHPDEYIWAITTPSWTFRLLHPCKIWNESENPDRTCQFLAHRKCEILGICWLKLPSSELIFCSMTYN